MATKSNSTLFRVKPKTKRPGIHAKSKSSISKTSKNYIKLNNRQGK